MKQILKKGSCFFMTMVLVCCLLPQKVQAVEFSKQLYATSAVLMDAESKRVLFGKCEQEKLANASTTKIMTLIVMLESCDLQEIVEISSYAQSMPSVKCNLRKGEKYVLYDLACSMMLESHNDSAVAIAEHVAGSVKAFGELMNQKAKEIGCENTYFITPNGLDEEITLEDGTKVFHGTTAKDLAKIMSYCILDSPCKDMFLKITQKRSHVFCDVSGKRSFTCTNHNALFDMRNGVLSGKTGFTSKAGYCYVGAINSEGRIFVVVLLACGWPNHKNYKWIDAKKLFSFGEAYYKKRSFERIRLPKQSLDELVVGKHNGREKTLIPIEVHEALFPKTVLTLEDESLHIELQRMLSISGEVKRGDFVGFLNFMAGEEIIRQIPLYAAGSAYKKSRK